VTKLSDKTEKQVQDIAYDLEAAVGNVCSTHDISGSVGDIYSLYEAVTDELYKGWAHKPIDM
jgi:hypothetical protein